MSKTIYETKVFYEIENEIFVHTQKICEEVHIHMFFN
jgi:hypothetical protein